MSSLEAQVIRGCRVQEHVDEDVRTLLGVEVAFYDASWLTLGCAADGLSLRADPQPMHWVGMPEHGHIEVHCRHELCRILGPGTTLAQERPLVGADQHTIGLAFATYDDDIYVFNWCGELRFARNLPPEISAMLSPQPPT